MKVLILDGSTSHDQFAKDISSFASSHLIEGGGEVESLELELIDIKGCMGCFGCWIKTPGICVIDDRSADPDERKGFVAMVNSGFPEAEQNETALAICRQFSLEANMEWLGGLALGGGMAIGGRPLKDLGGMTRNIVKALDTATSDRVRGKQVSAEARQRMELPIAPKFLFIRMGNKMWKKLAKENGVENDFDNTPYQ